MAVSVLVSVFAMVRDCNENHRGLKIHRSYDISSLPGKGKQTCIRINGRREAGIWHYYVVAYRKLCVFIWILSHGDTRAAVNADYREWVPPCIRSSHGFQNNLVELKASTLAQFARHCQEILRVGQVRSLGSESHLTGWVHPKGHEDSSFHEERDGFPSVLSSSAVSEDCSRMISTCIKYEQSSGRLSHHWASLGVAAVCLIELSACDGANRR